MKQFIALLFFLAALAHLAHQAHQAASIMKPRTTECYYFNKNSSLLCNSSAGTDQCQAKLIGLASEFKTFAISEIKATGGNNPYSWFRIYPRKDDNTGWWYNKNILNLNTTQSIHSIYKNTPRDEGLLLDDSICWAKLSAIIRTSKTVETIKAEKYVKSLFGFRYEKIKTIGMLYIVD